MLDNDLKRSGWYGYRQRLVGFATWPVLWLVDCVYEDSRIGWILVSIAWMIGAGLTVGLSEIMRDTSSVRKELVIFSGLFAFGLLVQPPIPKSWYGTRSLEEFNRGKLEKLRVAVGEFKLKNEGRPPRELYQLVNEGYLKSLPILWDYQDLYESYAFPHPKWTKSEKLIPRDEPSDSALWGYDPERGLVFIDCTHEAPDGRRWSDF